METKLLKKFEEMDADERKKLIKLLSETKNNDEKRQEKLDWIYKEEAIDREEYLLGKKIDSTIINEIIPETNDINAPGALFQDVITRRSNLDMQIKMREDPLYAIRLKEEETRKRLLENPLKMKKYQMMIEKNIKKGKNKKKEKKHKLSSSNEDSETDHLLQKYLAIVNKKRKRPTNTDTNNKVSKKIKRKYDETEDKDIKWNDNKYIKDKFDMSYNSIGEKEVTKYKHDQMDNYSDHDEPPYKDIRKDPHDSKKDILSSYKNVHFNNCSNKIRLNNQVEQEGVKSIISNKKFKSQESSSDYSNKKYVNKGKFNQKSNIEEKKNYRESKYSDSKRDPKEYIHHREDRFSKKYTDKDNDDKEIRNMKNEKLLTRDNDMYYEKKPYKESFRSDSLDNQQSLDQETSSCTRYPNGSNIKISKKKFDNGYYVSEDSFCRIENVEDYIKSKEYGLIIPEGVIKSTPNGQKISTYISPFTKVDHKLNQNNLKDKKKKLTVEEMEAKRQEMMHNAQEHDKERISKVVAYRIEEEREERRNKEERLDAAHFTKPMMLEHATKSSVEDRIKRNIYNFKKSKLTSQNFTKR